MTHSQLGCNNEGTLTHPLLVHDVDVDVEMEQNTPSNFRRSSDELDLYIRLTLEFKSSWSVGGN